MSRFRGPIGVNRGLLQTAPGIYVNDIEEIEVFGEIRNDAGARWAQQNMGETLKALHILSVVTPEDSDIDFNSVAYIVWKGRKWTVTSVQYKRPRVDLTLGGLYND